MTSHNASASDWERSSHKPCFLLLVPCTKRWQSLPVNRKLPLLWQCCWEEFFHHFFKFRRVRMLPRFLVGTTTGGRWNSFITRMVETEIFAANFNRHRIQLTLYWSCMAGIRVIGLFVWAKINGIISFVLPPICSHLLQLLVVSCYVPFETAWNTRVCELVLSPDMMPAKSLAKCIRGRLQ